MAYPATRREDIKDVIFGTEVPDPYRWLEDEKSPEVKQWMDVQDAFARQHLEKLAERDAIAKRLEELFYVDALSAPHHRGGRYFYTRRHADKEKSIVYVKRGEAGAEEVLFDPNGWSEDGSVALGGWHPSWNGKKVAYQVRENNSDEATMYLHDLDSGKRSEVDVIEGAKYAAASWTPGSEGFYYTWLPTDPAISTKERPGYAEVRYHALGTDPKKDPVVHERTGDASTFIGADLSPDGHWLVLGIYHGWSRNDVYFKDVRSTKGAPKAGEWQKLVVGKEGHYNVVVHRDRFYVMTDEGASRWRIFEVDPTRPAREHWKEVVAERSDATLESFSVLGGRLALTYLRNAASELQIRELDGRLAHEVKLPGIGTVYGPVGRQDEDTAYFAYESFTLPRENYRLSIRSGKTELYSKVEVPIDASPYLVEQKFYASKDGTRVSMFIVRRKDDKLDGSSRAMLYGYGGFQINKTPEFIASTYPWLERGGIFAMPNLRGGGEYGEQWHQDGMLLEKQNTFDDFIAAAEFLVAEGYTRPERLVISGGSNGGLLVGAAMTQRPDLFAAVLCAVPLLDMVRYHLFGSGETWTKEYGSAENEEQFKVLFGYSPYHRVESGGRYPALLLLSADSDDRVDPMHARKFGAMVQAHSHGGPVLLRIEKNSGHGGADMIKAEVEKGADRYAFALDQTKGGD